MISAKGIVAAVVVSLVCIAGTVRADAGASAEQAQADVGERVHKVMIPMRDGVKLSTIVFLPEAEGKYPVVLQRTPYKKENWVIGHDMWTHNGYVYVVQDVRGRFESEGAFYPFFQEKNDGYDTLAWIHEQAWCNGIVGMFGPSYMAMDQYEAISGGSAPLVKALIPTFGSADPWERAFYTGGVYSLFLCVWWSCETDGPLDRKDDFFKLDLRKFLLQTPTLNLAQKAGCGQAPQYPDFVTHYTHDDYWKALSSRQEYALYTMPVLLIAGWYDYYPAEMLRTYKGLVDHAPSRELAKSRKIIIGPWAHHQPLTNKEFNYIDFGPDSSFDYLRFYREWFDRTLKGMGPPLTQDAPIRIFVMGANKWRDEYEWPLARTQYVNYYLHSQGKANTLEGDGTLSRELPKREPPDGYTYDPENPVPSNGGNDSITILPNLKGLVWPGPADQLPTERRKDVLVYTSEPLEKDTEVTGPVVLKLYAASSAPDTDFVGRLDDVYPDGRAINITEGVIRARFRKPEYEESPQLIEPGATYEYTIDLLATSNVFKAGHRLRLDVTSSNFPLWDRNLNTGHLPWLDTEVKKADQSIYHKGKNASRLILPIIP